MIELYDNHIAVIARAESWSVSLLQFHIEGKISSDVFILTRCFCKNVVSELYHFSPLARNAFLRWVMMYKQKTKEEYIVKEVEL